MMVCIELRAGNRRQVVQRPVSMVLCSSLVVLYKQDFGGFMYLDTSRKCFFFVHFVAMYRSYRPISNPYDTVYGGKTIVA